MHTRNVYITHLADTLHFATSFFVSPFKRRNSYKNTEFMIVEVGN